MSVSSTALEGATLEPSRGSSAPPIKAFSCDNHIVRVFAISLVWATYTDNLLSPLRRRAKALLSSNWTTAGKRRER
jgi:hypothetical protein